MHGILSVDAKNGYSSTSTENLKALGDQCAAAEAQAAAANAEKKDAKKQTHEYDWNVELETGTNRMF